MGIFGSKTLQSEVDSLDIEQAKTKVNNPTKIKLGKNNSIKYGIDRAIDLVGKLKKHNVSPKVIAGIMKQTLESVEIHFSDIIADAQRKETDIHAESKSKDEDIQQLKEKFEALKQEKLDLQNELEQVKSVREFLQYANGENSFLNKQEAGTNSADSKEIRADMAQANAH